jgi:hypothetical protein
MSDMKMPLAAILLAKLKEAHTESNNEGREPVDSEKGAYNSVAEEIMSAIKSGNTKALAVALESVSTISKASVDAEADA